MLNFSQNAEMHLILRANLMKNDFENFKFLQGTPRLNEKLLELHHLEKKCNLKIRVAMYGKIDLKLYCKVHHLNYVLH